MKPKIYDCFIFFNELDLLELRLNHLNPYVDYFVLVESVITFTGKKKKLFYEENKELFKDFEDKIIHVVVDDAPGEAIGKDPWVIERHQRNSMAKGLVNCRDEDIIITSDLDEIVSFKPLLDLESHYHPEKLSHFAQNMFYYYLNLQETSGKLIAHSGEFDGVTHRKWLGSKMCSYGFLKNYSVDALRQPEMKAGGIRIPNGGWHFTYAGSHRKTSARERIIMKLQSFSHQEFNNNYYISRIDNNLESLGDVFLRDSKFEIVPIDEGFPSYIADNREKFAHLIKDQE
tara:strand:+ start:1648 stop:2508 length:861 start_codon:yes stop_codon:yes gene_type:complete